MFETMFLTNIYDDTECFKMIENGSKELKRLKRNHHLQNMLKKSWFSLKGPHLALFGPLLPGLTPFWTVLLKNNDKPMFKDNSKKTDNTKKTKKNFA